MQACWLVHVIFCQVAPFYTDWRATWYAYKLGLLVRQRCDGGSYYYDLWRAEAFFLQRVTVGHPRVDQNAGTNKQRRDFTYYYIREKGAPVLVSFHESFFDVDTVAVVSAYQRRTRWYKKCWLGWLGGIFCGPTRVEDHDMFYLHFPFCRNCRNNWYDAGGIFERAVVALHWWDGRYLSQWD